jgi:hypothetical protein
VLAGTVETAVNALWDAAPLVGARIAAVGGDTVGYRVAAVAARFASAEAFVRRARRGAAARTSGLAGSGITSVRDTARAHRTEVRGLPEHGSRLDARRGLAGGRRPHRHLDPGDRAVSNLERGPLTGSAPENHAS